MIFQYAATSNETLVVNLKGSLVAERCAELAEHFTQVCKQSAGSNLILSLQNVERLDASGIGALVYILKRLRLTGGSLSLCNVQPEPRRFLEKLHLHRAIPIVEADALPASPAVLELAA